MEEDITILDYINKHRKDAVHKYHEDKGGGCALGWEVYMKNKEGLIKRYFLLVVPHSEGGDIVWTCVEDNINKVKDEYKPIRLRLFDYKLFGEEDGGWVRKGIYGYQYLNHLIELGPGDWEKQLMKKNEVFHERNKHKK